MATIPKTIITSKNTIIPNISEIWNYKDLLIILSYKDYKVKYAQTFLGFLWAFIQPLLTLIIFIFIFNKALKVETHNIPYPLFALTGMTIWTYFSNVISNAGKSIISEQGLVTKIYFPRIIIPLSKSIIGLVDFTITLLLTCTLFFYYDFQVNNNLVYLPVFIILMIIFSVSIGIWISALTVRYRDFQHMIPFFVQIGLYASPVAYSMTYLPEKYLLYYYILNPIAVIIEGFRWCFLGTDFNMVYLYITILTILLFFISSLIYFRKIEHKIADII